MYITILSTLGARYIEIRAIYYPIGSDLHAHEVVQIGSNPDHPEELAVLGGTPSIDSLRAS